MHPAEHPDAEGLGGLGGHDAVAVDGTEHETVDIDPLEGVGHGHTGDGAIGTGAHGVDDPAGESGAGERSGGVVDEHDVVPLGPFGNGSETAAHRARSGGGAGHQFDPDERGVGDAGGQTTGRDDDDDVVGNRPHGIHRPRHDGPSTEVEELLGHALAEPGSRTCGHDDRPHAGRCPGAQLSSWSRRASASSSLTLMAKVSSETRI